MYDTLSRNTALVPLQVLYLLVAETADTFFNIALMYEPLIIKFGVKVVLATSPVFLPAAVTVVIFTPVQLFMAWRVKVLTGSNLAATGISVLSVVACGGGLATSASLQRCHRHLAKKKSGFADTDDHITRIMLITVQTGALTAIDIRQNSSIGISLSRLYTNMLLELVKRSKSLNGEHQSTKVIRQDEKKTDREKKNEQ
ncbi:hypothetical protein C8J56DRAFT_1090379 [Mycena floridula]|nr:hypothetical protein C8J56DRAFT_1090379 [Mycena floridula]